MTYRSDTRTEARLEQIESQIAELRSLYQEVFNMAARAVADIADAADKGEPTMGEKMLSMIRGDGKQ